MKVKQLMFNRTKVVIGNGATTHFWEDAWLGDSPLAIQYPSLYRIAQRREVLVATVFQSIPLNIQDGH